MKFENRPAAAALPLQPNDDSIALVAFPRKTAAIPAADGSAIVTYRTFIVQIEEPVVERGLGRGRGIGLGRRGQPPSSQQRPRFQHQIPMLLGMIVLQDD